MAKGCVTSVAAGALLFTALAEILPSCFEDYRQESLLIKLKLLFAFAAGFISMAILGIWA